MRENLRAALEDQIERKGLARMEDRTNVPLADILNLMVRERLTGEAPPASARALVNASRAEIEKKAGKTLDRLAATVEDQAAFGRIARTIIKDLEMGDDNDAQASEESGDDTSDQQDQPDPGEDGESEQESGDGSASPETEPAQASDRDASDARRARTP